MNPRSNFLGIKRIPGLLIISFIYLFTSLTPAFSQKTPTNSVSGMTIVALI